MSLFGRKFAVTTVPTTKPAKIVNGTTVPPTTSSETLDFDELAKLAKDTIIETVVGVGAVVIAVKVAKTLCNIAEIVVTKKL